MGEPKQWYGPDVQIRFQRWSEPTTMQTQITSSTTQWCAPFKEGEETEPQRLDTYVPVLLICQPQLKIRWKSGSVISSIYEARPLMCPTKPFLP